jgi:zinc transport system substrate-binding protein
MRNISFIFLLSSLLFASCKPKPAVETDHPVVTVTILPFKYFVEQLAGDKFRVNVLVPPGADHHSYEPAPRQLQEMEESKVLFVNGYLGFESTWLPRIKSNYPKLPVVDLSENLNLITVDDAEAGDHAGHDHESADGGHSHDGPDPHYWLSVPEAQKIAGHIARGLIQAEPSLASLIQENLSVLNLRLDSLNEQFRRTLNPLKNRSFIIFHPALNYVARDYNLTQYSMETAGKEPSASHFRELVEIAGKEGITTIFIQKEYDQENAETLAREIKARIVTIDPMSDKWLSEMERIVKKLSEMDR